MGLIAAAVPGCLCRAVRQRAQDGAGTGIARRGWRRDSTRVARMEKNIRFYQVAPACQWVARRQGEAKICCQQYVICKVPRRGDLIFL